VGSQGSQKSSPRGHKRLTPHRLLVAGTIHVGEAEIADAIRDRLLHDAHAIELEAESRRQDEKARSQIDNLRMLGNTETGPAPIVW
jgi:hypothetical protein